MHTKLQSIAIALLMIFTCVVVIQIPTVKAEVVWDNGVPSGGEYVYGTVSQNDSTNMVQVADDFVLTESASINYVTWAGAFFQWDPGNPVDFKIYFYADDSSGNYPTGSGYNPETTALASYDVTVNGTYLADYGYDPSSPVYGYNATLSSAFEADASTKYWMVIQYLGGSLGSQNWLWMASGVDTSVTLHAGDFITPYWGYSDWTDIIATQGFDIDYMFTLGTTGGGEPPLVNGWWDEITRHADWTARFRHTSVVYDNKMWVMAGLDESFNAFNDVWYSTDGANWTEATASADWDARQYACSVDYDGKMWVIGGFDGGAPASTAYNDVWYSTDGTNWTEANSSAAWGARGLHTVLNYDGKMWLMGGLDETMTTVYNDVWYSTDGANWTQATASADWSPRYLYSSSSVVYDGKMWIVSGANLTNNFYEVWYSTNGVDWTQTTADFPGLFSPIVSFDGKICTLGGISGGGDNNTWYSTDGITWGEDENTAEWSARYQHSVLTYDDKMWVIGGLSDSWKNDVWNTDYITPAGGGPGPTGGPTQWINVTLTPGATANISVSPSTWNGEGASIGGTGSTATDAFNLDNVGTVQCDVTIQASNTSAWTLATSPGHNQFQLQYGTGTAGGEDSLNIGPTAVDTTWGDPSGDWSYTDTSLLDDVADDDSAYIYATATSSPPFPWIEYVMQNHTTETGTILNVTLYALANIPSGMLDLTFAVMQPGTGDSQNLYIYGASGSEQLYSQSFTTNWHSENWTWADIDDLIYHFGISGDGTINVDYLYATVFYETEGTISWTNIGLSPASFENDLAYNEDKDFGLKVFMPTSTSTNTAQVSTITFSATAD